MLNSCQENTLYILPKNRVQQASLLAFAATIVCGAVFSMDSDVYDFSALHPNPFNVLNPGHQTEQNLLLAVTLEVGVFFLPMLYAAGKYARQACNSSTADVDTDTITNPLIRTLYRNADNIEEGVNQIPKADGDDTDQTRVSNSV